MQQTKSIMGVCAAKQSRGRPQSPLVASAEAKSLQQKRPAPRENDFSRCWSVAPIWRDNVQVVGKAAWGRVCGRAKLLRRDAALPATKAAGLSANGATVGADEKGRSPPLTPSRDSVGDTFKLCPRVNAEISPLRRRPEGFAVALWTASHPQLSLLSFIETNLVGVPFVPKQQYKSINRSVHCEGDKGATAKPPCRSRRSEIPCNIKNKQLKNQHPKQEKRSDHCYANPQFFLPDGVLRAPHRAPEPRQ